MKKAYFILLSLLLLAAFFAVNAMAMGEREVDPDLFMCEKLTSDSASILAQEGGSVIVSFRSRAPIVELVGATVSDADGCNALRIVLKNNSTCNELVLLYAEAGEDKELRVPIARRSAKTEYFLYLDNVAALSELSLSFAGAYNGTVEIFSIGAVSVYDDEVNEPGAIIDCIYNSESRKVLVSGTIDHGIVTGTRNARVGLYAFDMGEEVTYFKINQSSPLASAALSVRFEFEVKEPSSRGRFLQYVVAITDADGRALYTFVPKCPAVQSAEETSIPFKGAATSSPTLAVRADVGLAVVDVYLDRLANRKDTGFVHIVDNQYFYMDRAYVAELDRQIKQYEYNGEKVYLRFLLSADGEPLFRSSTAATEGVDYYGICPADGEERLVLFAYTDFLCTRYVDGGCVGGIIVGRGVDHESKNNAVGALPLAEYTKLYGDVLYVISQATWRGGRSVDLVVPVTGEYDDGRRPEAGDYPTRLFLISLSKLLESRFGEGLCIRVMVEDSSLPSALNGGLGGTALSAERMDVLEEELRIASSAGGRIKNGYFYFWSPESDWSEDVVSAAYLYNYYKLSTGDAVCYIFSDEHLTDERLIDNVFDTVKYADTQLGITQNAERANLFGKKNWTNVVEKLDMTEVAQKDVFVYENAFVPSIGIRGSYVMWDYRQGRSIYDWYVDADGALSVEDTDGHGRVLVASVSPLHGNCTEIVYSYAAEEVMSVVDMLSLDVFVDGEQGKTYRLLFEIGGEKASCEVVAEIPCGQKTTVYLSTLALDKNDPVRNIRMFWSTEDGNEPYRVYVSRLAAHSVDHDDEALEREIIRSRLSLVEDKYGDERGDAEAWRRGGILIALVMILGIVVVLILSRKGE